MLQKIKDLLADSENVRESKVQWEKHRHGGTTVHIRRRE